MHEDDTKTCMTLETGSCRAAASLSNKPEAARPQRRIACFSTSLGPARTVSSLQEIPAKRLAEAFAGHCKDLRYHEILNQTLAGQFDHYYLILENSRTGQVAIQPLFFANQDITDGLPPMPRSLLTWPRILFPQWLCVRMLVVGCSAGEGALDYREPWIVEALNEALTIYAKQCGVGLVLLKDFPSSYRTILEPLTNKGYRRVASMPACILDFDFASFDEYLKNKLGRTFRESLRRKLRKQRTEPELKLEVVSDAGEVIDAIYPLYLQTYERSKMRFELLTKNYFSQLGRELPERIRFFLWSADGKIIAFALCMIHDGTIHHLNIGFDYSVSLKRHLYYVTFRDMIEWALENGLKHYLTGQLNYDPKFHLRMKLAPLDLYARHISPLINPAFKLALGFLQPARHDPILRQFENAREL
ncbi:MAG: hypothetical protein JWL59_4597 [Chthoniobacteraceae bacterium]|nr:hypothetical protein [Chthoniobacteraceae bacterium]